MKNPIKGKVKSRLAISIGEDEALAVYHDLLDKCRKETDLVNAQKVLYYSNFVDEEDEWEGRSYLKKLQEGGDLGSRIRNAMIKESTEESAIVLIGTDCYDLTAEIIEEAFYSLKEYDLVLGPANDGGYYLIGFNQYRFELFEDIEWSTEKVFNQTLSKARNLNMSTKSLNQLVDLDTINDLKESSYNSLKYHE